MVPRCASRLFLLAALLWVGFAPSAFALRAPSASAPVPSENRVGGSGEFASGRLSIEDLQSPENAMGCEGCDYESASGRLKWLNQDPIGEDGGINLYEFVGNSPINYFDPDGLQIDGIATPGLGGILLDEAAIEAAKQAAARAAARAAIAAAAAAGTSFCPAPKDPCKGLRNQLNSHLQKLQDYIKSPDAHDNLDLLKGLPANRPDLRDRLIDGRIRNLQKQIDNFRKQLDACEKANGLK